MQRFINAWQRTACCATRFYGAHSARAGVRCVCGVAAANSPSSVRPTGYAWRRSEWWYGCPGGHAIDGKHTASRRFTHAGSEPDSGANRDGGSTDCHAFPCSKSTQSRRPLLPVHLCGQGQQASSKFSLSGGFFDDLSHDSRGSSKSQSGCWIARAPGWNCWSTRLEVLTARARLACARVELRARYFRRWCMDGCHRASCRSAAAPAAPQTFTGPGSRHRRKFRCERADDVLA